MPEPVARLLWSLFEPIHGVIYFTAEARAAADAAGYKGFWMGYFAFRSAPLGRVGPDVATAAFYGFHPSRARRALPDAWSLADPDRALDARRAGAVAALRHVFGDGEHSTHLSEAADLLWEAAQAADAAGRVLGAANQQLPRPPTAAARLWQAATTLRELRGDGHVAALVAADVDPIGAHLLKIAAGETEPGTLRASRNWPDDEWAARAEQLVARGWISRDGRLTESGHAMRGDVEARTDRAAAGPWRALGSRRTERLGALLEPLASAVVAAGAFPLPNPVGVPPRR